MENLKGLALFDFDGTITKGDSFGRFLLFSQSWSDLIRKSFSSFLPLVKMYTGLMSRGQAKEQITGIFFKDWSVSRFDQLAKDFSQKRLAQMVRPLALRRIKEHQYLGHRIVVVTASPDRLIQQWTSLMHIELIATELELHEDLLTGKFNSPNCAREEKVRRIKSYLDLEAYETIYAYGNSASDRPMMTLAHHSEYQPFRKPDGYTTLT